MFLWEWLQDAVSWVLVLWHQVWSIFLDPDSGWAWTLSVVGLVVVVRVLLIPLFVKQPRAQRKLQGIQPRLMEIQATFAGDKERQSEEMMALDKASGTNPLASCLPILAQAPIFLALLRVLQDIAAEQPVGVFGWPRYSDLMASAHNVEILGVPLYDPFVADAETPNPTNTRILAIVLMILMLVTSSFTQRYLLPRNTASAYPMAEQMPMMMAIAPAAWCCRSACSSTGSAPSSGPWDSRSGPSGPRTCDDQTVGIR